MARSKYIYVIKAVPSGFVYSTCTVKREAIEALRRIINEGYKPSTLSFCRYLDGEAFGLQSAYNIEELLT